MLSSFCDYGKNVSHGVCMAGGISSLSALLWSGKNKSFTRGLYMPVSVLKPVSYEARCFPFCK